MAPVPVPVEGDSDSSGDSSLSSVPSNAFDNAPMVIDSNSDSTNNKMSSQPVKSPGHGQNGSNASGTGSSSSSQQSKDSSHFETEGTAIPTGSNEEATQDQGNSLISLTQPRTRSSTKPKITIKVVKKDVKQTEEETDEAESEEAEAEDEIMVKGRKSAAVKSAIASKWTEENVTAHKTKSPLVGENLRDVLASDAAADALPAVARAEINSMLPANMHRRDPKDGQLKPNAFALRNADDFRADAVRYVDDLESGNHEGKFIEDAAHARWQRSSRQRDAEAVKQFQAEWGVELPEELLPAGLKGGKLREAAKPIDLKKVGADEKLEVLRQVKMDKEAKQKIEEDKLKEGDAPEEEREVPMVKFPYPKKGRTKYRIPPPKPRAKKEE